MVMLMVIIVGWWCYECIALNNGMGNSSPPSNSKMGNSIDALCAALACISNIFYNITTLG